MTLFVHHGPRLGPLADHWASLLLTEPLTDPFTADVVAVPTAGVRDWLSRRIAERIGIAANIEMPFPGRFVATALGASVDDDPWTVERLVWAVLAELDTGSVDVPGWHHASTVGHSRRYAVADRRIADLFDGYATNRPELVQQWSRGAAGPPGEASFEWQVELWRHVRARIAQPSTAERLPGLLDGLRSGSFQPALPSRVGWFGTSSLPSARLAVLRSLAVNRDVHLYVVHPSPSAWRRTTAQLPGALVPRRRGQAAAGSATGHPLLRSWGRSAAELAAVVQGLAATDPKAVELDAIDDDGSGSPPTTLLGRVQADIVADRPPVESPPPPRADGSIQVHACHGATRQLEVLRDVLAHLFVADPTLLPSDVLVVCPDLERFRPFAAVVFSRGALPVPLAITDLSLGSQNPVAAALAEIIRVASGRCTSIDLLGVAGLEPVRRRLGLTMDDVDRIASWISELGTSWGFDADHRSDWLGEPIGDGTWEATVSSLLLGAVMPSPEPRRGPGHVVPFDDMSADAVLTAGRLAELVHRLRLVADRLGGSRPMAAWCDVLRDLLGMLCAAEAADAWQMVAVTEALDDLAVASVEHAATVELEDADLRTVVDALVAGSRGRLRLRTGHVTLTGLVPVRNLPARVICVLGFDEVSLRLPGLDGDDLIAMRPCIGEPDRRGERRQLLLDALLAAGDHFVITCDGSDVTTNRRLRFPVQLTELLDIVDPDHESSADGGPGVVVRHPLRSYDESTFQADGPGGPFGFDEAMCRAAVARRAADDQPHRPGGPTLDRWSLSGLVARATVDLSQLSEACARPARTLLREGLDIRLPGDAVEIETMIPIGVGPLERSGVGRRLADQLRTAALVTPSARWPERQHEVVERWREAEALRGGTPPGDLGVQSIDGVERELVALATLAATAVPGLDGHAFLGADGTVDIDIELDPDVLGPDRRAVSPIRLVGTVGNVATTTDGPVICRASFTRPKWRTAIDDVLALAAVTVSTGATDWSVVNVTRGTGVPPACQRVSTTGADPVAAARRLLDVAAGLHHEAVRRAIPLFEKSSAEAHKRRYIDEEYFLPTEYGAGDLDDADTVFVWGGVPLAEILVMQPDPLEYADHLWGAIGAFAAFTDVKTPGPAQGKRR